jgi:hypothetical protein
VAHPTTAAGRVRDFRLIERIAINEQMGMAKAKADTLYGSMVDYVVLQTPNSNTHLKRFESCTACAVESRN